MAEQYEEFQIDWRGQGITVRWCPEWLGGDTAHLEIVTSDRLPHPISQTGYRSHFCPRGRNALWAEDALHAYFEASKNQNPCKTEDASEGGST